MRVRLKDNVRPRNLVILAAACNVFSEMQAALTPMFRDFPAELWITAGIDGKHKENSKHYSGNALDLRSKAFPSVALKQKFARELSKRLGPDYQVILEDLNGPNEHIHAEYDPRPFIPPTQAA